MLSELAAGAPMPEAKLAYFEQRALNNFYDYVMSKFRDSGLRKADIAKRVNLSPSQLNRYLASPKNWTIATVQRLLLGIAAEEALLASKPFLNRPSKNLGVIDLLDDTVATFSPTATFPQTSVSYQVEMSKSG